MPQTGIIIVNYNGKDVIIDCLRALERQSLKDFDLIIVDNGSSDNSLDLIRNFSPKHSFIDPPKIVALNSNKGFAAGNSAGLGHTEADYVAVLNNDAEPERNWLRDLVIAMETNPNAGICASKLIVHGADIIDSAGDGYATSLKAFKRGEGENSRQYVSQEHIFGACAGAALYRRKMLDEIGFFDDDFFLIHEDTDLNFRAQLAGWKVAYVPSARVYHKVRSTIGPMSDMAVYYTLRNSEFVRIKNVPFSVFLRCLPSFILGAVSELIYFAVKHGKLGLYLKAKKDAIKNVSKFLPKRKKILSMKKVDDRYILDMMTSVWNRQFFFSKVKKFVQS
ncbi:MAG: glycosyltransferase family 2 protein [Thermodesulfovibrionales bacterium]|jgi:GT2 family glycosyltransferase